MPLDPDLEGFLELAELGRLSGKQQPLHALSVAQARAAFAASSAVLDPSPPGAVQASTMALAPPEDKPVTYTCFGSIAYCGLLRKRLTRSSSTAL